MSLAVTPAHFVLSCARLAMASYDPAAVSASADPAAAAMSTSAASAVAKGKGGAMYHCDYCRTDISSQVRIRCAECTDFDLCLDCFCAGVRVPPHVPSHSYRVIEHVRQPLFDERWGADEELLLLEAIEMFGFGNWSDIAEHVSTKTKTECETHYNQTYLASPAAPLPDITTALTNKQQQLDGGSVKHEDDAAQQTAGMKVEGSSSLPTPAAAASSSSGAIDSKDLKPASTAAAASTSTSSASATTKSGKPVSAPLPSRPKPKSGLGHLVGYIPNRGDFDQEYENDAELLLADMEFKEEDTKWEKELKLKVLDIYNVSRQPHAVTRRLHGVAQWAAWDVPHIACAALRQLPSFRTLTGTRLMLVCSVLSPSWMLVWSARSSSWSAVCWSGRRRSAARRSARFGTTCACLRASTRRRSTSSSCRDSSTRRG